MPWAPRWNGDPSPILWTPGNLGREIPALLNAKDSRVKNPDSDALLIGLLDPMAAAKRRADPTEAALKKKAEKAGAALVKWMDRPSGHFEA